MRALRTLIKTSIGYVVRFDPELEVFHCTQDMDAALHFTNARAAFQFLRRQAVLGKLNGLDLSRVEIIMRLD